MTWNSISEHTRQELALEEGLAGAFRSARSHPFGFFNALAGLANAEQRETLITPVKMMHLIEIKESLVRSVLPKRL